VGGLLSGENLVVEFLPSCSRELFELAYVLGVEVGVIEVKENTCGFSRRMNPTTWSQSTL